MEKIFVFHGVNLHKLGIREPEFYGATGLDELNAKIIAMGAENGFQIECRQTNHEGEMVDWITDLGPDDFLILNPGAWTHTSYALFDAIKAVKVPVIEVHISNIYAREGFRANSVTAGACLGQISGLGTDSYLLALAYGLEYQKFRQKKGDEDSENR